MPINEGKRMQAYVSKNLLVNEKKRGFRPNGESPRSATQGTPANEVLCPPPRSGRRMTNTLRRRPPLSIESSRSTCMPFSG